MSCVLVATRINARICDRCHQPIRRHDDQVRILRVGISASAHWSCFIRQLRESDQRTAAVVEEVVR
jgi:hypothetical protein